MRVSITFQSPYFHGEESPPTVHERHLDSVPKSKAEEMVDDFIQFQEMKGTDRAENSHQRRMYRYEKDGEELLVALDFGEVVALVATGDDTD